MHGRVRRRPTGLVTYVLFVAGIAALLYQLIAIIAAVRHMLVREPKAEASPAVSILKPVRGLDPHFYEAIRSHAVQDYPEFEILFGVTDPEDLAIAEIERLAREFPKVPIRLVPSFRQAPNGKVGVLCDLAAEARHPILLVNDSDMRVPPDYLQRVATPLDDAENGLVTCLYRAHADSWPSAWEALGIAIDFMPSVLVAPLVGVREFGLGSTLAFRAEDLAEIGGFASIADYLADDYQLARRITSLGTDAVMSKVVVETNLGDNSWAGVWRHQVRWARTIRVSRGDGYAGLPVTHAGLWALIAAVAGVWWLAAALAGARIIMALAGGVGVLGSRQALFGFALAPLWDLWAFAVWAAGLFGKTVEWRGKRLRLDRTGRILS